MNKWLTITILTLLLLGCSKSSLPETSSSSQERPHIQEQVLKSERIGSLAEDPANSPNAFYNEMVNGRTQFSNKLVEIDNDTVQQTINNDSNTLIVVLLWKKLKPNEWENIEVNLNLSNNIDEDSLQAYFRFPYRLKDRNTINKAKSQNIEQHTTVNTKLANGAILTIIREASGTRLIIK